MELPDALLLGSIKKLKPGDVIKCPVLFDGETVIKRLVVVSSKNNETILALTTTSQKIAPTRWFGKNDIYLEPGSEKLFELPTYVQLHRVICLETAKLLDLYKNSKLEFKGAVSTRLLGKIYAKIAVSEMIERKNVKQIMDEKGQ